MSGTGVSLASSFESHFAASRTLPRKPAVSPATYDPNPTVVKPRSATYKFSTSERFRRDSHAPFISHHHSAVDWSGVDSPGPAVYDNHRTALTKPRVPSVPWVLDKAKLKRQQEERALLSKVNREIGPGSYNLRAVFSSTSGDMGHDSRFKSSDNAVPGPVYRNFDTYQTTFKQREPSFSFGGSDSQRLAAPEKNPLRESEAKEIDYTVNRPRTPGFYISRNATHVGGGLQNVQPKRFGRWGKDSSAISKLHADSMTGLEGPGPAYYNPVPVAGWGSETSKSKTANGLQWVP